MKRTTRNKKVQEAVIEKPTNRERFMIGVQAEEEYSRKQAIPFFEAANQNQKRALAMLREGRSVIFLTGSAGTGKSMLAAYHAACQLKQKTIEKVFLVRPAVAVGKSVGLLPGDVIEKMTPYFAQTIAHLDKFMGHGFLSYCLEKNKIEMKPAEYLRGMSFENCVVIVEESQNFTKDEFEMVLTRLGNNCTIIFTGDEKQHDLKVGSGLHQTLELLGKILDKQPEYMSDEDLDEMEKNIGIVEFKPTDVVRSGLTRSFVKMYYNE